MRKQASSPLLANQRSSSFSSPSQTNSTKPFRLRSSEKKSRDFSFHHLVSSGVQDYGNATSQGYKLSQPTSIHKTGSEKSLDNRPVKLGYQSEEFVNNFSVSFGKSSRPSARFGGNLVSSPQQKGYALKAVYLTGKRGSPDRVQTTQVKTRRIAAAEQRSQDIPISINSSLKYTASNKDLRSLIMNNKKPAVNYEMIPMNNEDKSTFIKFLTYSKRQSQKEVHLFITAQDRPLIYTDHRYQVIEAILRDFSLDLVPETSQYSISRNSQTQNYTVKFTGKTVPVCKECEMSVLFELSVYYGLRVLCRSGFCSQEILYTSGLNSFTQNELWNHHYPNKVSIYDITDIKETSQASRIVMTGQYKHRNISRAMSRGSIVSSSRDLYSANTSQVGFNLLKNDASTSLLGSTSRNKSQRSWTSGGPGYVKRAISTDRLERRKLQEVSPINKVSLCVPSGIIVENVVENVSPVGTPEDYEIIGGGEEDPGARDEIDDLILKYLRRDQPESKEKVVEAKKEELEQEVGKKRIRIKKLNLKEIGKSYGEITHEA